MSKQSEAKAAQAAPIIKFKTDYRNQIERIEVEHESEQCVWVYTKATSKSGARATRRAAKHSEWDQYHDSWAAAHAYLMDKVGREVTSARRDLELANSKLGNIKGMKPPKDPA